MDGLCVSHVLPESMEELEHSVGGSPRALSLPLIGDVVDPFHTSTIAMGGVDIILSSSGEPLILEVRLDRDEVFRCILDVTQCFGPLIFSVLRTLPLRNMHVSVRRYKNNKSVRLNIG